MRHFFSFLLLLSASALGPYAASDGDILVRAENLTHSPSTGPVTHVLVHNASPAAVEGVARARFPKEWRVTPAEHAVSLAPGEMKKFSFAIEKATDLAINSYPVHIAVEGNGFQVLHKQNVVCASAPFYKPEIDGDLDEWDDSIPIALWNEGKLTRVRTYWNKRAFSLAVEVEESAWSRRKKDADDSGAPFDAIQFALAPRDASRDAFGPNDKIERYEFLAVGSSGWLAKDKCFTLIAPGALLSETLEERPLDGLETEGALVVVKRKGNVTRYEISVPYAAMPGLRATIGRSFFFSLLVHDPDGVGVRNLGEKMSLLPRRRHAYAWSRWKGAKWGEKPEWDAMCEWGLASSIH